MKAQARCQPCSERRHLTKLPSTKGSHLKLTFVNIPPTALPAPAVHSPRCRFPGKSTKLSPSCLKELRTEHRRPSMRLCHKASLYPLQTCLLVESCRGPKDLQAAPQRSSTMMSLRVMQKCVIFSMMARSRSSGYLNLVTIVHVYFVSTA